MAYGICVYAVLSMYYLLHDMYYNCDVINKLNETNWMQWNEQQEEKSIALILIILRPQ